MVGMFEKCEPSRLALALLIALGVSGAACQEQELLPDPIGLDLDDGATLSPSLENIQEYVFTPGCAVSGCHTAEIASGGLDLSSIEASYESLVGAPALNALAAENRWLLVKPNDSELSFLLRKLQQPGLGEGTPMPPGPMQLNAYYLELIESWIDEGAQR